MNKVTKEELKKFIKKNISYDCDGGERCPHCKEYFRHPYYWIYHKATLAGEISTFLGIKNKMHQIVYELIEDFCVTGESKLDSERIANEIWEEFYE